MLLALAGLIGATGPGCDQESDADNSDAATDETPSDEAQEPDAPDTPAAPGVDAFSQEQLDACDALVANGCDDAVLQACAGTDTFDVGEPMRCEMFLDRRFAQLSAVSQYTDDLRDYTAYAGPVSYNWLKLQAYLRVLLGDGSDYSFAKAIYSVFIAIPQGHSSLGFVDAGYNDCYSSDGLVPGRSASWYGVCGRAAGDSAVVTYVDDLNPLGLDPGDEVIAVHKDGETWQSPGFLDRIREEPLCDAGTPSRTAQRDLDAVHLFAHINEGDTIDVRHPDGDIETIEVPARGDYTICLDPFRRPSRSEIFESYQREDGIVVVELATLGNHPDHPFPSPLTLDSYRQWNAEAIELINADLEQYQDITGLIWDIRGNRGGSAEYGMGLIGSLGGAQGELGNCYGRIAETQPPEFSDTVEYPFPYQVFADQPLPEISFAGSKAVVVDGAAGSAADWMLYRASQAGVPIFGHDAASTYGYTVGPSYVNRSIEEDPDNHPYVLSYISGARCYDGDGELLEGRTFLDYSVDLDPQDLANGIDTQIEAAAAHLIAGE